MGSPFDCISKAAPSVCSPEASRPHSQSGVAHKSNDDGDDEIGSAEIEPVDRLKCKGSFLDRPLEILMLIVACRCVIAAAR